MTSISSHIDIDAPREKVWAILSDLGAIQNFHPVVKKSYYTTGKRAGTGAARVCELAPMGVIEETILEWEEGERFVLSVVPKKHAPPFEAEAEMWIESVDGGTRVHMTIEYTLKGGLLGRMMNLAMVRPQFSKATSQLLAGLKHHAETGKIVSNTKALRAVPDLVLPIARVA